MAKESRDKLYLELNSMETMGVSIWLDGRKYEPRLLDEMVTVNEDCGYNRNYITDGRGELTAIRYERRIFHETLAYKVTKKDP